MTDDDDDDPDAYTAIELIVGCALILLTCFAMWVVFGSRP